MYKDVIVIGAGQAGLAMSYYLQKNKISHLVLEQHKIGDSWERQRWDSFRMNTPNWMTQLPGKQVDAALRDGFMGKDEFTGKNRSMSRDGFMSKDEFVKYLRDYAVEFGLPVLEAHKVISVTKDGDEFKVLTKQQTITTQAVVMAAGIMNQLQLPMIARQMPPNIMQLHAGAYKNPAQLPAGNVLVVGAGQSGVQIAEELALAGRPVYLASSKVPRAPRRVQDKDVMEWMQIMGMMDTPTAAVQHLPKETMTQPQVSGVGPLGHTVSYQSLHKLGVKILGSMDGVLTFKDNAREHVVYADKMSADFRAKINAFATGEDVLDEHDQPDVSCVADVVEVPDFSAIIWATGFGYDFSWVAPELLDEKHIPKGEGIYCIGFPWLTKKKSGLVFGVDEDARLLLSKMMNNHIFGIL